MENFDITIGQHVRYHETDSSGEATETAYILWFDACRSAWIRKHPVLNRALRDGEIGLRTTALELNLSGHQTCSYDDHLLIQMRHHNSDVDKIKFEYVIKREDNGTPVANGYSVHMLFKNGRKLNGKILKELLAKEEDFE
jgi:YbgC/YbaW family acyl-CoA thioester hydrolase